MTVFRPLLRINHERQKPLFCPKTLARQALEPQVFRPESLQIDDAPIYLSLSLTTHDGGFLTRSL